MKTYVYNIILNVTILTVNPAYDSCDELLFLLKKLSCLNRTMSLINLDAQTRFSADRRLNTDFKIQTSKNWSDIYLFFDVPEKSLSVIKITRWRGPLEYIRSVYWAFFSAMASSTY